MKKISALSIILLLIALISSCAGGGTQGTGGIGLHGARLIGSVIDVNGDPLSSVTITSLAFGDTTTTDKSGKFDFMVELNTADRSVNLEFEKGAASANLKLVTPEVTSGRFLLNVTFDTVHEHVTKLDFSPE